MRKEANWRRDNEAAGKPYKMKKALLILIILLFLAGCEKEETLYCYEMVIVGDYSTATALNLENAKHMALEFLQKNNVEIEFTDLFGIKSDLGGYRVEIKKENVFIPYNGNPLRVKELQLNKGKVFAQRPTFC